MITQTAAFRRIPFPTRSTTSSRARVRARRCSLRWRRSSRACRRRSVDGGTDFTRWREEGRNILFIRSSTVIRKPENRFFASTWQVYPPGFPLPSETMIILWIIVKIDFNYHWFFSKNEKSKPSLKWNFFKCWFSNKTIFQSSKFFYA
jgi:hypothetical protein